MKYKVGDRVKIVKFSENERLCNILGTVQIISQIVFNTYALVGLNGVYSEDIIEGLADEEWKPKEGDIVLVKDNEDVEWEKAIFLYKDKWGFNFCVSGSTEEDYKAGRHYGVFVWDQIKKLEEKKERKLMMTDSEWESFQKNNNLN